MVEIRSCQFCLFAHAVAFGGRAPQLPLKYECRRRAPHVYEADQTIKEARWLRVQPDDWCGEWKSDTFGEDDEP